MAQQGALKEDNALHILFNDNGIGIPDGQVEKVFGLFKRLHPKDKYEGAGIGLALSQKAIAKLGGKIIYESREGFGSTFKLLFPL